jgi:hypothetical protein
LEIPAMVMHKCRRNLLANTQQLVVANDSALCR